MKSPLRWPGGKGPLASWIVGLMPPHIHYVEPYFGAGSVLFAKDPEGHSEVVNDLNGELMNFWDVLRDPQLFDRFRIEARLMFVTQYGWERSRLLLATSEEGNRIARALAFFVTIRQSLAARGKCFTALSKTRTRRGMNEQAAAWLTAVEGLPAVHERLKRVVILCKPALDVIRSEDGPDTLFYLDPPYLPETRHKGGGEYGELEMSKMDHNALIDVIQHCKGKVMISGYHSELYNLRLDCNGWTRHEKVVANHASHADTKGKEVECLWCNF